MAVAARNAKAKGSRFEQRTAEHLATWWPFTTRCANSDGICDVVAVGPSEVLFVECKSDGRLYPEQWNALYHGALEAGGVPILARPVDRRRRRGAEPIEYLRLIGPKVEGRLGVRQPFEVYDVTWGGRDAMLAVGERRPGAAQGPHDLLRRTVRDLEAALRCRATFDPRSPIDLPAAALVSIRELLAAAEGVAA